MLEYSYIMCHSTPPFHCVVCTAPVLSNFAFRYNLVCNFISHLTSVFRTWLECSGSLNWNGVLLLRIAFCIHPLLHVIQKLKEGGAGEALELERLYSLGSCFGWELFFMRLKNKKSKFDNLKCLFWKNKLEPKLIKSPTNQPSRQPRAESATIYFVDQDHRS